MPAPHPLVARLERSMVLSSAERAAAARLPIQQVTIQSDQVISREGDRPSRSCLVASGMACTSKVVAGGARQIMALHIANDMPDLHSLHLKLLDSDIWAITDCTLAYLAHEDLRQLCHEHPRIADELWRITLVDASVYREWMVSIGRRPAISRLAHLFCELMLRLEAVGLARDGKVALPLTQADLGEAMGLSVVHINRTLQELRALGLIAFGQGVLEVRDWTALVSLGDFRSDYLHLRRLPAPAL